jgi:hypothetical protein
VEASRERVDDETNRAAAVFWALGSVLRLMGSTSQRAQNLLDKNPKFTSREKKALKLSKSTKKVCFLFSK